jgi:hypothetical protein
MTPEIVELAKVVGLPAAVLLYMWMNRAPATKDPGDPAKQVLAKLDAMEDRIIDLQAEIKVLLDRRKP